MMSAAGTPSTDPYVIVARERARYEEQFKSLKPTNNGIITGDQAKGFFLQSQLPPLTLGQIWALADTDADGKMDVNEFSIACKLINLKLRGFEIPKSLPPSLLASLRTNTPPVIPPLPNPSLISAPPRPEPPKPALVQSQPTQQPLLSNLSGIGPAISTAVGQPIPTGVPPLAGIPTGIVPPMQTGLPQQMQPLIGMGAQPLINQVLPTSYVGSGVAPMPTMPLIQGAGINSVSAVHMSPVTAVNPPIGPGATSTPRSSIPSLEKAGSIESPLADWAVSHHTKLKYTQMFNTTDRARSGFLSGAQARNIMVHTGLPQGVLAQIWGLSDMDSDGRLGCEEFVLAMHLCEQAALGHPTPAKLAPDLIPPSFRRTARTASISSQGSAPPEQDPASTLLQGEFTVASFEDKRKENFEKGQAELDRRRKALLDQQKKEAEERERKEREEMERRERARQEAEKKRIEELERQMREQQEQERLKEEERKRQADQRESARREMERQRQLEWEKQRLQELQQQRQREQENVLKLKAKNQSLTIELSSLTDQVKDLSQKICDTRLGVSNVKTTIDGMRSTRDSQMQEMSQLKNKLKEQNTKLLSLSQEKVKLDAKNKLNNQDSEQAKIAYDNKEITIKNLKEKIDDMQKQIEGKLSDIENNNTQLTELRTQLNSLLGECESLYSVYEEKRGKVLELRNTKGGFGGGEWKTAADAWGDDGQTNSNWPADDNWGASPTAAAVPSDTVRYKAIYEFVARNSDEISFQPGDIVNVLAKQTGEPGWLAGEIRGSTGWFPESYVIPADNVEAAVVPETLIPEETTRLEGITEVPEVSETTNMSETAIVASELEQLGHVEYYIANYPYQSQEQGDLTFNAGDVITVIKKEGDWWTGKVGSSIGIFPSNYVQKVDVNSDSTNIAVTSPPPPSAAIISAVEISNTQVDNEVSQINEDKTIEKPLDLASVVNAQTMKGKKPEIASVIAPYQATSTEQLSLARGQLIMIRKKTDSGWWEGELQAKGRKRQVGWFPASYVKVLNSSGRASGRTTPVSTSRIQQEIVLDKVVALFPYTAGNPDELTFAKDDIISVTAREEEAWWRGELNGISGLFPSNYVAPLQQQSVGGSSTNKKRQDSIREFIQTEKVYVDDMSVVHDVFEAPLTKSGILHKDDVQKIFVNWQVILRCNRDFLEDLYDWTSSGSDVLGPVITKHLKNMQVYETFCGKQLDSAALLQKLTETSTAFRDFMRKCQNNVAIKGMPLSSFLIKPMQRITRYPLLISKILESTSSDHPDCSHLQDALKGAECLLNDINENVRQKENQERYDWLQRCVQNDLNIVFNSDTNRLGPRKLIHFGGLTKVKSGKELVGFLFNDFFLLIQPNKSLGTQFAFQRNNNVSYKMYKQPILCQDLSVHRESTDNVEQGTDSNRVLKIQDNKNKYTLSLLAATVNECNLWVKRIENCKDVSVKIEHLSQNRPKTKPHVGKSCGRLLVVVQKGKRFVSSGKPHTDNVYCKVALGDQKQQTDLSKDTTTNGNVPQNGTVNVTTIQWNYSMQFQLRNLDTEVVTFVVYGLNLYCPDEFLGRAELKVIDILRETQNTNGPIIKKLILHQVESGEILVKLDLQLFNV